MLLGKKASSAFLHKNNLCENLMKCLILYFNNVFNTGYFSLVLKNYDVVYPWERQLHLFSFGKKIFEIE